MKLTIKKIIIFFIFIIFIISSFSFLYFVTGKNNFLFLKSFLSTETKLTIKKYLKPKLYNQEKKIKLESINAISRELEFKKKNESVFFETAEELILSNNKKMIKYKFKNGFYGGIHNNKPGSGYIDFHAGNILVLSSRGVLIFGKNLIGNNEFNQIKNNLNDFIGYSQFKKDKLFSIKDILIKENQIYVSFTEEIKENCWNTSIVHGDMNYSYINFEKFFSSISCVLSIDNPEREFNASQSGGRMISLDEKNILFTIGDYRNRFLAQDLGNINGKIIKINILNKKHEIVSMGHRNPQGLYLDKQRKIILETEHGPNGGDEINLIKLREIENKEIQNFGWPIVSAGEHYGKDSYIQRKKYEKYPLYKSHSKYGFIEPLKSFVPSIGISEIIKLQENQYLVSSMKDKALYFFELNNENNIVNLERSEVFERVRDIKIFRDKIYLFLEDSPSIGVINYK